MARRQHLVLLFLLTLVLAGVSAQVPNQQAAASATAESAGGGIFVPVSPARLLQATSGAAGNMTAGETRSIQVLGTGGIPSSGVSAVVVDLGAHGTTATTSSYLTAWPSGVTQPVVVSMYYTQENSPRSNTAIVEVGANGRINLYNYAGTTSVTVDVQGYFTSTSGETSTGGFKVTDPSRIANTAGWEYGDGVANQMLGVGQALDIQAEGLAGIPSTATALFVNVEIRNATTVGTTWIGAGGSTQTWPVSMEYGDSGPYSQGRTVPLDSQGRIRIKNLSGSSINIKVDVQGFFTAVAGDGASFNPLTPANVYSTSAVGQVDLAGGQTRTVNIAGKGGIPTDGAASVALTISVKNWTSTGTVGVFPSDIGWPGNSTVAFVAGQGAPSNGTSATTIVRLTDGKVSIHNTATQSVQFTVVAQGWFSRITEIDPVILAIMSAGEMSEAEAVALVEQLVADSSQSATGPIGFAEAKNSVLESIETIIETPDEPDEPDEQGTNPIGGCQWSVQTAGDSVTVARQGVSGLLTLDNASSTENAPVYSGEVAGEPVEIALYEGLAKPDIATKLEEGADLLPSLGAASRNEAVDGEQDMEVWETFGPATSTSTREAVIAYSLSAAGSVEHGVPDEDSDAPAAECVREATADDDGAALETDEGRIVVPQFAAAAASSTTSVVRYRTFIEPEVVSTWYVCGKFQGDGRGFSNYYAAHNRTRASIFVHWASGYIETSKNVGTTHRLAGYARGEKSKTASSKGIRFFNASMTPGYARLELAHAVGNPLCDKAGDITYNMVVEIWKRGAVLISGTKKRAPHHEAVFFPHSEATGKSIFRRKVKGFRCLTLNLLCGGDDTVRESL